MPVQRLLMKQVVRLANAKSLSNKKIKERQKGFTLIELIVVIVILGILAATAMPKYLDMRQEARRAVVKGFAGLISSEVSVVRGAYLLYRATHTRDFLYSTEAFDIGNGQMLSVYGQEMGANVMGFPTIEFFNDATTVPGFVTLFNCAPSGLPPVDGWAGSMPLYKCGNFFITLYPGSGYTALMYIFPDWLDPVAEMKKPDSARCAILWRPVENNVTSPSGIQAVQTDNC